MPNISSQEEKCWGVLKDKKNLLIRTYPPLGYYNYFEDDRIFDSLPDYGYDFDFLKVCDDKQALLNTLKQQLANVYEDKEICLDANLR